MINKHYAKMYCSEDISKIENYDIAIKDDKTWVCHHRYEIRPFFTISKAELILLEMYFKRPSKELIFMPLSEHRILHMKGKKPTEQQILKIKEKLTGRKVSEETKKKLSNSAENQKKYIKCIETGEVCCGSEWRKKGFDYARIA